MGKRKKVWMVQVDPRLLDDPKFLRYARMAREDVMKLENLYEHAALGILIRLWMVTMRDDDTGKLDPAPEETAEKLKWVGPPPEALLNGLLNCGKTSVEQDKPGFIEQSPEGLRIYKWAEWQNDPAGKREKWAEAKRRGRPGGTTPPPPPPAEEKAEIGPKDECVRQILKAMKQAHTPGSPQQKSEYARAWIERPGIGGAKVLEVLMHPDSRGQDVFWLNARLGGKAAPKAPPASDIASELRKKFMESK